MSSIYRVKMYEKPKLKVTGNFTTQKLKKSQQIAGVTSNGMMIVVDSWLDWFGRRLPGKYTLERFNPHQKVYELDGITSDSLKVSREFQFIQLNNEYVVVKKRSGYFDFPAKQA